MRFIFICSFFLGASALLSAQNRLEGLWEGSITLNGINSTKENRFQMLIHYEEGGVHGRSYIYLDNGEILEMEIKGKLYGDWSLSIYDIKFMPIAGSELQAPFKRKYQLVYKTSIWETSLNGYWQEIKEESFDPKRSLGRISLKKLPQVAAKP